MITSGLLYVQMQMHPKRLDHSGYIRLDWIGLYFIDPTNGRIYTLQQQKL